MFSNRRYGLKLAAAAGLVAVLGVFSAWHGESIGPAVWRCLAQPARWHGTVMRTAGRIVEVRAGSFVLDQNGAHLEVRGDAEVTAGQPVEVSGTFDRAGPFLRLEAWRTLPAHGGHRKFLEALSVVVLAAVVLNLLRHFSFRPEVLRAETGR